MPKIYKHISKPEHSRSARAELGIAIDVQITPGSLEAILHDRGLTKKMNTLIGSLIAEEGLWDEAMELGRSNDDRTAFRASWGLEWAYCLIPTEIEIRARDLLEDLLATKSTSVQRVYSKMLCDMLRRGALKLDGTDQVRLAERSFDLLINPETPVAVKAWQVELLSGLMEHVDWIEEQLTPTVRAISEDPECTPGMAAVARHYFRRLKKTRLR